MSQAIIKTTLTWNKIRVAILSLIIFSWFVVVLFVANNYLIIPFGEDWETAYRPAIHEVLMGHSPYNIKGFYNPPWTLLPLIPIAILSPKVGSIAIAIIGFFIYIYVSQKLSGCPYTTTALLMSPAVYYDLQFGNINWLFALGLTLPPQLGLFFVLTKPQMGFGVAVFWLVESFRNGGVKSVIKTFLPLVIVTIISGLIFNQWILKLFGVVDSYNEITYNTSLWPVSLPIGLVILIYSLRSRKFNFSIIASPFFSPYILVYAWVGALIGLLRYRIEMIAAVIGFWITMLLLK